jgi:hypothetical protein
MGSAIESAPAMRVGAWVLQWCKWATAERRAEGRCRMERQDARPDTRSRTGRISRLDAQAARDTRTRRAMSPRPSAPPAPTSRPAAPPDLDLPTLRLPALATPPSAATPPAAPGPPGVALSPSRSAPRSRALTARKQPPDGAAPLVVPPTPTRRLRTATATAPVPRGRVFRWSRPVMFGLTTLTLVLALAFGTHEALQGNSKTPPPSGRAPWYAFAGSAAIATVAPPPPVAVQQAAVAGAASPLEPCHESTQFLASLSQWAVPPGCYSLIYTPNPANYIARPGFGWCNWWVRVTHPAHLDITESLAYPRGTNPVAGAPIYFDGNEQGADSAGHWAVAVAVAPDHYWVLISEMNFAWRGGGFGKIDYRYIHVSPNVHFVYVYS